MQTNSNKRVVVIGAGFGGLSTAALLAKQGYKVTVLEKNSTIGGRAQKFEANGFTFDMGPSWYLMPDVYENFFEIFGKKPTDYFELKRLDPRYKIFFPKNVEIDIPDSKQDIYKLFDKLEKDGAKKLKKYLEDAEFKYNISLEKFIFKPYKSPLEFFNKTLLVDGKRLNVFKSLHKHVQEYFEEENVKRLLEYSIVFLGGSPKNSPSMYSLISHLDLTQGVYYPIGGFAAFVDSIKQLAIEHGAQIHCNKPVSKIIIDPVSKTPTGVTTQTGEEFSADIVVTNADYAFAETNFLEPKYQTHKQSYWNRATLAPSGYCLYLGLNSTVKNLTHHNLMLNHDWLKHFDEVFKSQKWPTKPSYYVCCPTKTDSTIAPNKKDLLFVLVPMAYGIKDTQEERQRLRNWVLNDMKELLDQDIESMIEYESDFSINDYKTSYNAYKGTALGLAHTLFQSALWRPKNFSKKVKNLYYVGHYTNPGTGVPMAVISAQIVANLIKDCEI